ncbi:MAG: glycosyltransferase [Negativicutes bacterium]|nr:glycosyltransferase [Negativicutes bacterium]
MKILFVHPNFPGQFLYLAAAMGQNAEDEVVFLSATGDGELTGVKRISYTVEKQAQSPHSYVRAVELPVFTGEAVWRVALSLRRQGFVPDVIYGHGSWGAMLFLKEVFPEAVYVVYCEWFMHSEGQYLDYGGRVLSPNERCHMRSSQVSSLLTLLDADAGISPFLWQKKQFPLEFQRKIKVIHDGVDTERFSPLSGGAYLLKEYGIPTDKELLTYVSRGMEPIRGFPQFAAALAIVQKRRPNSHAVVVGKLQPAYEQNEFDARQALQKEGVDLQRVHFLGTLPRYAYRKVLQASSTHVYLTKPFVLSWSFLDALSCGCAVVASATPPVQEVVEDGKTAFLASFHDPEQLAERIEHCMQGGADVEAVRKAAREIVVQHFSLKDTLRRQRDFLHALVVEKGVI